MSRKTPKYTTLCEGSGKVIVIFFLFLLLVHHSTFIINVNNNDLEYFKYTLRYRMEYENTQVLTFHPCLILTFSLYSNYIFKK